MQPSFAFCMRVSEVIVLTLAFYCRLTGSSTAAVFASAGLASRSSHQGTDDMHCQQSLRQSHIYNILFSLFFWKKKYFHPKCFNSALWSWLKPCLASLTNYGVYNSIYFMVFRKTKCWPQCEGTTNLDFPVIKTVWKKNFISHSGERFGLTCTARWSSASGKESEPREPSHPVNSAFSLCLKVGG